MTAGLLAGTFAACGGDDDDGSTPTTSAQAGGAANTAAEMVPDVSALGFRPADDAAPALETPNTKVVVFENPGGQVSSLRLEIAMVPTSEAAAAQFSVLADALRNPPPDQFPGGVKQTDGTPVFQADQSRSYKTDRPDAQQRFVFSDMHRFGRAIVIMYTIGPGGAETEAVRKQLAEQMSAKAPR